MAVKAFRLDVVPEISARLADILKQMTAAPVKHPAVVAILDAGLEGTTAFLAMEYVAAETLDVSLRRFAPANLETAVPMLRQVAEALEASWAAGVGHGALHPRDIFVVPPMAESPHGHFVLRVSGFGVADALEALRILTPVRRPYSAPEREHAGDWDIRADVYSLGIIAHELLTGRRPSDSLELDNELPEDTSPNQRIAIRHALSGALATDADHRFGTPMAFVDALETKVRIPGPPPEAPVVSLAAEPIESLAVEPVEPWPVEPVSDDRDEQTLVDANVESEAETDPEAAAENDAEPEREPEPESIWIPGPDPEPEPEPEPEPVPARATVAAPAFLGVQSQPDRREPFQPFIDAPKENAMPRILGVAAICLAVGTGFGYWLRGPAPAASSAPLESNSAPEVTSTPAVTRVPEEPIGTDVAVTPAPAPTPPAQTPRTTPAAQPTRPAPASTTGSVRVETRPARASVSIDGRSLGTTPVRVPELSPGSHTVRVTLAGYKPVTTTAVVRAGQQTLVRLSLEIR